MQLLAVVMSETKPEAEVRVRDTKGALRVVRYRWRDRVNRLPKSWWSDVCREIAEQDALKAKGEA